MDKELRAKIPEDPTHGAITILALAEREIWTLLWRSRGTPLFDTLRRVSDHLNKDLGGLVPTFPPNQLTSGEAEADNRVVHTSDWRP